MERVDRARLELYENSQRLSAKLAQLRMQFFGADLALCCTFARIARTEHNAGDREGSERSLAYAERGYAASSRFLRDPKYTVQLSTETCQSIKVELRRLRMTLNQLRRLLAAS